MRARFTTTCTATYYIYVYASWSLDLPDARCARSPQPANSRPPSAISKPNSRTQQYPNNMLHILRQRRRPRRRRYEQPAAFSDPRVRARLRPRATVKSVVRLNCKSVNRRRRWRPPARFALHTTHIGTAAAANRAALCVVIWLCCIGCRL